MKFSIILPSLLADFPGAATGRDKKLIRAINSVLSQSFTDFELIVVSDGCELTKYLVKKYFTEHLLLPVPPIVFGFDTPKIRLLSVDRKQLFSNTPRNTGIENAKGEYILYLDNDDYYGKDHLLKIDHEINIPKIGPDWVYFDDHVYNGTEFVERSTDCTQYGRCGTSNICHASRLNLRWIEAGYGHDYHFIQQLLKFENHKQIGAGEYFVCHYSNGYCV